MRATAINKEKRSSKQHVQPTRLKLTWNEALMLLLRLVLPKLVFSLSSSGEIGSWRPVDETGGRYRMLWRDSTPLTVALVAALLMQYSLLVVLRLRVIFGITGLLGAVVLSHEARIIGARALYCVSAPMVAHLLTGRRRPRARTGQRDDRVMANSSGTHVTPPPRPLWEASRGGEGAAVCAHLWHTDWLRMDVESVIHAWWVGRWVYGLVRAAVVR